MLPRRLPIVAALLCVAVASVAPLAAHSEAQNAHDQLFGFERIAELLGSGAGGAALVTAVQNHGQEDDITVQTLQFAPAEVMHA